VLKDKSIRIFVLKQKATISCMPPKSLLRLKTTSQYWYRQKELENFRKDWF